MGRKLAKIVGRGREMSFIWNVMLSFDNEELWEDGKDEPRETCEPLERINTWLDCGQLVSLIGPTFEDGSGYGMDANLYGGGFTHFDIKDFIKTVQAQDWKEPSKVQLWVKGAEEGMGTEPWTLIKLRDSQSAKGVKRPTRKPGTAGAAEPRTQRKASPRKAATKRGRGKDSR